jgi:hypothetical protein
MKRTLYIPEELSKRIDAYLKIHPEMTFSRLGQRALEREVGDRDVRRLLRLAGIVKSAPVPARERAEDRVIARER